MNGIEIPMADIDIQMDDVVSKADPPVSTSAPVPPSRNPEEPMTTFFADQVERSLVSVLWHHPEFVPLARQELDFEFHISVLAYRKILQAIGIVYGDLGVDLDWTTVAQCLEDMKALDECGGRQGLDQIFSDDGRYPAGRQRPEPVIHEYIRLLREYAIARGTNPFQALHRYVGHGIVCKNKFATRPQDPTVIGALRCPSCGHNLQLRGWPNGAELKLKAELERQPPLYGRH